MSEGLFMYNFSAFKPQSTHRVAMDTFHHDGKISPSRWCKPFPFHSIYHHEQQGCGVHSSLEGRYTPPISPLPPLCTL